MRILITISQILEEEGVGNDDLVISFGLLRGDSLTSVSADPSTDSLTTGASTTVAPSDQTDAEQISSKKTDIVLGSLATNIPATNIPGSDGVASTINTTSRQSTSQIDTSRSSVATDPATSPTDEAFLLRAFQNVSISTESRRRIIRQCLDMKRLMDKEGSVIYADSSIQKALFSKSATNISVLFRCLRTVPDIDTSIVITNLLIRLVTTSECNQSNVSLMAKKNLAAVLLRCLQLYHQEYLAPSVQPISPNLSQRLDDVLINVFTLMIKMGKLEPKMPLLARLHNSINISIEIIQRWMRRDHSAMLLAFNALKLFATKNESSLSATHRAVIISMAEQLLKNPPPQINHAKLDGVIELLSILCRSRVICNDILHTFGARYFLTLVGSTYEGIQRASLKLLRTIIDFDFGKRAFESSDGAKVLTDTLHTALHSTEGASVALSSTNSIPALLVSVLRAAVSHSDLPFLASYHDRVFPLPSQSTENGSQSSLTQQQQQNQNDAKMDQQSPDSIGSLSALNIPFAQDASRNSKSLETDEEYERIVDMCSMRMNDITTATPAKSTIETSVAPKQPNASDDGNMADVQEPGALQDKVISRLQMLCPELMMENGHTLPPCEPPASNIRVRHVQPMAPGRHVVCKNQCQTDPEFQVRRSPMSLRKTVFEHTARMFQSTSKGTLVYDVNDDKVAAAAMNACDGSILFESRFESGNLQMAIRISQFEYDLLLQTDINASQGKHNQWFYFSVQKMIPNAAYKFNILNMSKPASQFNHGMQPVVYSLADPGWRRSGECVFYIKNHYKKPGAATDNATATYSTLVFTLVFKASDDTCFIAYHYPYTYSELQRSLYQLYQNPRYRLHCRRSALCQTLGGNECVLLTITDFSEEALATHPMRDRKYVLLSSRVHPGESNASHIIHGLIQFLLSADDVAVGLRRRCVFKIVPMLNPDGVVNGSHRCSLSGLDLNRQWKRPSRTLTPTVFWTKLLWRYIIKLGHRPLLTCDFHGHSRRKNVFVFGCENATDSPVEGLEKVLPHILATQSPIFDFASCRFGVERSKETTARVVMWREFGVVNSFTLESSYCGADFGERKGMQFGISDLERMGADFCRGLYALLASTEFCGEVPSAVPTPLGASMASLSIGAGGMAASSGSASAIGDAVVGSAGLESRGLKTTPSSSSSSTSTPARSRKKRSSIKGSTAARAAANASEAASINAGGAPSTSRKSSLSSASGPTDKSMQAIASGAIVVVAANVTNAEMISSGQTGGGRPAKAGPIGHGGNGGNDTASSGTKSNSGKTRKVPTRRTGAGPSSIASSSLTRGPSGSLGKPRSRRVAPSIVKHDSEDSILFLGEPPIDDVLGEGTRDNASNDSSSSDDNDNDDAGNNENE